MDDHEDSLFYGVEALLLNGLYDAAEKLQPMLEMKLVYLAAQV